jgi:hypothetical protein
MLTFVSMTTKLQWMSGKVQSDTYDTLSPENRAEKTYGT